MLPLAMILDQCAELGVVGLAPGVHVKHSGGDAEVLLEAAREIGRGRKPAGKRDRGQRRRLGVRHQSECLLEAQAFDEVGRGLSDQGLKDTVEMERREPGGPGKSAQGQRLSEVHNDMINRTIDALDVGLCSRSLAFFRGSQDSKKPWLMSRSIIAELASACARVVGHGAARGKVHYIPEFARVLRERQWAFCRQRNPRA